MKILKTSIRVLALLGIVSLLFAPVHAAEPQAESPGPATASGNAEGPAAGQVTTGEDTVDEDTFDEDTFDEDAFDDEDEPMVLVADPIAPFNRTMFVFNDILYFGVIRPVASAYRALVPELPRTWLKNFFYNISGPRRMISCLLQGKGQQAEAEFVRFCMNSTVGLLGFGNPAGKFPELNPPLEDLGQTFAVHGVGEGFYVMLPFLGPHTLRDAVGRFGDGYLHPFAYVEPFEDALALKAFETVNEMSFRLGDYEALREAAIVPYDAIRNAYIQYRRKQVQE